MKFGRYCSVKCRFARSSSTAHSIRRVRAPAAVVNVASPRDIPKDKSAQPELEADHSAFEGSGILVASVAEEEDEDKEPLDAVAGRIRERMAT